MPQVPVYGDRQVRTAPLQPVFQRTPDVSSGARSLAQGLDQVAQVADRLDLQDSQDAAFKAEAKLREDWQQQRAKLRQQYKGDQAEQYKAAADEWWGKAREEYGQSLSPRAQALAGKSMAEYKMAQDADTLAYVEREKTAAREINFKSVQANIARESLQNATPATASALAGVTTKQLRDNALKFAAANGYSSDVADNLVRDQIDNFHKSMALTLATRPDGLAAAQTYLAENSKEMLPADRDAINRQVELTAKQAKVQRESDASDAAWQLAAQGKPIPPNVLASMDGRERFQLQETLRARAERLAAGKPVKTDPKTLASIYDMARENPEEFAKLRLGTLTEKVSPDDIQQIASLQRASVKDKQVLTSAQLVGSYTKDMRPEKKGQFEQVFYNRLLEFKEKNQRNPSDKEQKAIIDDLMMRRDNAWYQFGDTRKWQMSDTDQANATFVPGPNASKPPADKFETGKIYVDKNGNRAKYLGYGKWENL